MRARPHTDGEINDENGARDRARNRPLARAVYVAKTLPGAMGEFRRRTGVFETTVRAAEVKTYISWVVHPMNVVEGTTRSLDDDILLR